MYSVLPWLSRQERAITSTPMAVSSVMQNLHAAVAADLNRQKTQRHG